MGLVEKKADSHRWCSVGMGGDAEPLAGGSVVAEAHPLLVAVQERDSWEGGGCLVPWQMVGGRGGGQGMSCGHRKQKNKQRRKKLNRL